MAGKKVRCKSCQEIFVVSPAGTAKPPSKPGNGSQKIQPATRPVKSGATSPPPEQDDDPDAKPAKKTAPKKKSSTGKVLLIVGGIGAALLLACCVVPTVLSFVGVFGYTSKVNDIKQAQVDFDKEFQKAMEEQQKAMKNGPGNPGPGNPMKVEIPPGPGNPNPMANPPVKVEIPNDVPNPFAPKQPANLADALKDLSGPDRNRRQGALNWLQKQPVDKGQQADVARALEPLLNDNQAQAGAARALQTWGTMESVAPLAKFLDSTRVGPLSDAQSAAIEALAKLPDPQGAEAVGRFLPNVFSGESAQRALQTMGQALAEKTSLKYYHHPDGAGRGNSRQLLKAFGTKDSLIVLQSAEDLKSPAVETRHMAADYLGQLRPDPEVQPQVAKALEGALGDADPELRAKSVRALTVWGGKDNVPALVALLDDVNPRYEGSRREAILVLGKLKDEQAIPALVKCLNTGERENAGRALQAIGAPAEKDLLKYVGDPASNRDGVMEAQKVLKGLGSKENAVVTLALTDLKSTDAGRRHDAARRLGEMPGPDKGSQADVAKALAQTLDDPDRGTREEAAKALIVWATPDVVPTLLKAMDDSNVWVRHRSMEALGKMKEESAARPIATHLVPGEDRQAASKALQLMVGTKAEDEVRPYLVHTEEGVVIEACKVLGVIGTKSNKKTIAALQQIVTAAAAQKKRGIAEAALAAGQAIARR
jgi:HEAT repeat protein